MFLESILENLPVATTVKNKNDEGRYRIWNKKAAEMMEVPAEDLSLIDIYAVTGVVVCKEDAIENGIATLLRETERARQFGFTETEYNLSLIHI